MIELYDPEDRNKKLVRKGDFLVSADWKSYPIINGIPRFIGFEDAGQQQTSDSFSYKWKRATDWGVKLEHHGVVWDIWKDIFNWQGPEDLKRIMKDRIVLDAGCGSGSSMKQFVEYPSELVGAEISGAVDVCKANFPDAKNLQLVQADINKLPLADEQFDVVWSNGVLHHTPDTYQSLKSITRHCRRGGLVVFYIYVKKSPMREFSDDYLRDIISEMPVDKAWERMEVLTHLSKSLAEMNVEITVEEDFQELGFKKGKYDLQRFVFYNIFKCFWNSGLSFQENVLVNFDWYRPKYSHRHTPEEVKRWLLETGLEELSFHVSQSGISVIARRV